MDGISNLPDEVLTHILSFLPTKQAVATSVLSRRWTHLWLSVPTLDFSDTDVTNREASFHFTQFVGSVLHHRDATQLIQSFRLSRESKFINISRVKKWIDIVSLRRVEHIHLKWLGTCPKLPRGIFTCKTLVVLKLEASFVVNVNSSSSVELPSLKILNLERIELHTYGCFMRFLSGCPNLEDLRTDHINVENLPDNINEESQEKGEFKSLALSKLTRADIVNSEVYFSFKAIENIKFLRIEIDKTDMDEEVVYVKYDEATWVEPEFVPECFSFHLRTCTIRNFLGQRDELWLAKFIMKNARVLQTFTICTQGQVRRIERKLSSCQRGSATCQLLVY